MIKLVTMLVICFVPDSGHNREAWRIERQVTLDHCLTMNQIFSGGGRHGAITVKCS